MKKILTLGNSLLLVLFIGIFQPIIAAPVKDNDDLMTQNILVYINKYRVEHHLSPLKMDSYMSLEARKHSMEMANHVIAFGHQDFNKRIKRIYKQVKQPQAGAENIAYNYKDAQDVVKNWLKSPGHHKNIVGNYNLTGIGIARDQKGKIYFTQLFLRASAIS